MDKTLFLGCSNAELTMSPANAPALNNNLSVVVV